MNIRQLASITAIFLCVYSLRAEIPEHPYPDLTYKHESQENPAQKIFAAYIDLTNPDCVVRVSRGGPDPDGNGPWQTALMRPTKIADRENFDVVINGDFFTHLGGKDAEGVAAQGEFKASTFSKVAAAAETDGVVWSKGDKAKPMIVFSGHNQPTILMGTEPPPHAKQAISGSHVLLKNGENVAPAPTVSAFTKGPHPRTAVGIADNGKTLILVAVDGRKKGVAVGMSLQELADVMKHLGATEAINLDGGGSTMLGIRDPQSNQMVIVNKPSDGAERPVANVLGVTLKRH